MGTVLTVVGGLARPDFVLRTYLGRKSSQWLSGTAYGVGYYIQ
jgi:hypothetical protein